MTDADRRLVLENCRERGRGADRRHPRHRHHDRHRAGARRGAAAEDDRPHRAPWCPTPSAARTASSTSGSALSFVQALPHGVYVAMNGRCFPWDDVVKNRELGVFETAPLRRSASCTDPSDARRRRSSSPCLLGATQARAQSVQITPFVGYAFGGSVQGHRPRRAAAPSTPRSPTAGTLSFPISASWRFELLYSRQDDEARRTGLSPSFDVTIERYLGGFQEEKGRGQRPLVRHASGSGPRASSPDSAASTR